MCTMHGRSWICLVASFHGSRLFFPSHEKDIGHSDSGTSFCKNKPNQALEFSSNRASPEFDKRRAMARNPSEVWREFLAYCPQVKYRAVPPAVKDVTTFRTDGDVQPQVLLVRNRSNKMASSPEDTRYFSQPGLPLFRRKMFQYFGSHHKIEIVVRKRHRIDEAGFSLDALGTKSVDGRRIGIQGTDCPTKLSDDSFEIPIADPNVQHFWRGRVGKLLEFSKDERMSRMRRQKKHALNLRSGSATKCVVAIGLRSSTCPDCVVSRQRYLAV